MVVISGHRGDGVRDATRTLSLARAGTLSQLVHDAGILPSLCSFRMYLGTHTHHQWGKGDVACTDMAAARTRRLHGRGGCTDAAAARMLRRQGRRTGRRVRTTRRARAR